MNRAFLDAYNRELALLRERGKAFAEEFPNVASRLGGLIENQVDPTVAGLLEGAAFLAARVQVKLDSEFRTFTTELIGQLMPSLLCPTPSMLMLAARPGDEQGDPVIFATGSHLEARTTGQGQRTSCRYRLAAALEIWPLRLVDARLLSGMAPIQALGIECHPAATAALQLTLARTGSAGGAAGQGGLRDLDLDRLTFRLCGEPAQAGAIQEMLFGAALRLGLRWLDRRGAPVVHYLDPEAIEPLGLDPDERVLPEDGRSFQGFALLREFFAFPQLFPGFRLTGLRRILETVEADRIDLVIESASRRNALPARVGAEDFALFAVPAVNLFEESCASIKPDRRRHEYLVSPDIGPAAHFEVYRINSAVAFTGPGKTRLPIRPLYERPAGQDGAREVPCYATERRAREIPAGERRVAAVQDYPGTDLFVSLFEPSGRDDEDRVQRLQLRMLCSNRHLPLLLLSGEGVPEYRLTEDVTLPLVGLAGPTRPRPGPLDVEEPGFGGGRPGAVHWRMISLLSLNMLGLDGLGDPGRDDGAGALRELLSIFADLSSAAAERQIHGILRLTSRPIVRPIRRAGGPVMARGLEISLVLDERAFEGSGIFVFAMVIDRFLAEYASVNSFTQLVLVSEQRGRLRVWPPRTGRGPLL